MDTLGDGYTPADLRAVIAGEKAHTPRKSAAAPVKPEKRSGNLLVDIQTKLRAGKGAGYARWATLFNLKQMAQTVAYLQDHELLDYAVLSEKAAEASAHFNELSARIKAAETRMAEIAVLREHIVNYAKTRDTYVAYRKAGYSKKFLAEHESEVTIHKAAKNYFDGLGLKKLPTIKALNTEYAELLAEKKAAYADYRKAREEMKELLTAKANIDRILELDKEQEEANERREKEAGQRPNKHETGGFRVNGIRLFSQSGYRFALLAAFLPPVRTSVFPLYPYYNLNRVFWPVFRKSLQKQRTFKEKIQLIFFFSFYSTRFHAIRLSKYNCSVRVEDEYHTEHGQAALRRDFNFDSPVTQ